MKERRGTMGRLAGLAEGVAAAGRRRQREREPRVILYDAGGSGRLVGGDSPDLESIVEAAEEMIELSARRRARDGERDPATTPSTTGVSVPSTSRKSDHKAESRGGRRDEGRSS